MTNSNALMQSFRVESIVPVDDFLMEESRVFLVGEINSDSANDLIKKLMYLDKKELGEITIYINSPFHYHMSDRGQGKLAEKCVLVALYGFGVEAQLALYYSTLSAMSKSNLCNDIHDKSEYIHIINNARLFLQCIFCTL